MKKQSQFSIPDSGRSAYFVVGGQSRFQARYRPAATKKPTAGDPLVFLHGFLGKTVYSKGEKVAETEQNAFQLCIIAHYIVVVAGKSKIFCGFFIFLQLFSSPGTQEARHPSLRRLNRHHFLQVQDPVRYFRGAALVPVLCPYVSAGSSCHMHL